MAENKKEIISKLIRIVDQISSGDKPVKISSCEIEASDDPLLNELSEKLSALNNLYSDSYQFIIDLSRGNLNTETPARNVFISPYKQLQSELRYLTWQIQQIADGDYNQRVFFSGEFSYAINKMVLALRERQQLLNKLEESNKTKNQWISVIAHDLNDPIHTIEHSYEMLVQAMNGGDYEKAKEYAEMIRTSSIQIHNSLTNALK